MADDEWQLEAVNEQFNVFDTINTPFARISQDNFRDVLTEVRKIRSSHMKMKTQSMTEPINDRAITAEIIKSSEGDEIRLSFVVLVTNIEMNNSLCKMPIFVLMKRNQKVYIDLNLALFTSWKAYLTNNSLPPCQYCFPVGGEYRVGGKLAIDFGKSPAAIKVDTNIMWKGIGFMVAVGLVVGSFFFRLDVKELTKNARTDSLLKIADEFIPGIQRYGAYVLKGALLVQQLRSGDKSWECFPLLWKFLIEVRDEFSEEIDCVFKKVTKALRSLYNWISEKLKHFFEKASKWARDTFLAVVSREDDDIIEIEVEVEEILEASRRNNCQSKAKLVGGDVHVKPHEQESNSSYADQIFRNAKTESALHCGMKTKDNSGLHPQTIELLELSNSLALNLNKTNLKDVQDIFEVISSLIKEEYKSKIDVYSKMLEAAKCGSGTKIDVEMFNKSLGIEGDVRSHYWQEAMVAVLKMRNMYQMDYNLKIKEQKTILVLPIAKRDENTHQGLFKLVGVNGAGLFSANELIKVLKENKFNLSEDLKIIERSGNIIIQSGGTTISAVQELNSADNTSEGMLHVDEHEA